MTDRSTSEIDFAKIREKYFPLRLDNGFSVKAVDEKEMREFISTAFNKVFPRGSDYFCFQPDKERSAKGIPLRKLYNIIHHEWFLFYNSEGNPVGWSMGEAEDFQTFYMRNTGILPEHQNRGLYTGFARAIADYLRELGYERITSQHKPTNRAILILKLKQGFDVAGLEMTENWGALVKLVKILHHDRREAYYKMFGDTNHLKQELPLQKK